MNSAEQIEAFRRVFANAKHVIVVAGAGLSAASGSFSANVRRLIWTTLWRFNQVFLHSEMAVVCGGLSTL